MALFLIALNVSEENEQYTVETYYQISVFYKKTKVFIYDFIKNLQTILKLYLKFCIIYSIININTIIG